MDVEGLAITNLRQFEYENMVDIHTYTAEHPTTYEPGGVHVYVRRLLAPFVGLFLLFVQRP